VRNTLETLKRSGTHDEPVRQAYAVMDRQLAHLVRLVDDLIDVSRIHARHYRASQGTCGARLDPSPFARGQPPAG
jgi:signal transduction histidine kinase